MTTGSRALVIWESSDLVNWSAARLVDVEGATAGMAWAPSAIYDAATKQWFVFWASRLYATDDPTHAGPASNDRIRYATTKDFRTFSAPRDYLALADTPIIDQEFRYLGKPNHWARYIKNETVNQVWVETTTSGLFGEWTRVPGYVRGETPREGAASFADNITPGKYYLLLDDYNQYLPYRTTDVNKPGSFASTGWTQFPEGLKHGSVTPLTKMEYDAVAARYLR